MSNVEIQDKLNQTASNTTSNSNTTRWHDNIVN
jgi:hypothetical protein